MNDDSKELEKWLANGHIQIVYPLLTFRYCLQQVALSILLFLLFFSS